MNWLTAGAAVLVLWSTTVWGASLTWDPDSDSAALSVGFCLIYRDFLGPNALMILC